MMSPPHSAPLPLASRWLTPAGGRVLRGGFLAAVCLLAASLLAGCATFETPLSRLGSPDPDEHVGIGDVQGPTERRLRGLRWEREKEAAAQNAAIPTAAALEEYDAADQLYHDGKLKEAEKAFRKIAREHRYKDESFSGRVTRIFSGVSKKSDPYAEYGDPIEEDALFMVAECQFEQRRYSWAQDSYDELLERYPSTRHLDTVTRRMFRIAHYWLGFPESDAGAADREGEVELAGGVKTKASAAPPPMQGATKWPLVPNFTDHTRPVFDTPGRALQALRSVWLHDASGPLADDALMLSANYNLMKQDYIEAARLYDMLRDQYPDSEHFKDSYLLGSHVMLASYAGPAYEGTPLDEAEELKKTARQIFPDLSPEQQQRLDEELQNIAEAQVGRIWERVEFYQRKNQPPAVALYCHMIINRFPESEYAQRARDMLKRIEPQLNGTQPFYGWGIAGRRRRQIAEAKARKAAETAPNSAAPPASPGDDPLPPRDESLPATDDTPAPTEPSEPGMFDRLRNRLRQNPQPVPVPPDGESADPSEERRLEQVDAESGRTGL